MIYELLKAGEDASVSNAELSRRLRCSEREIRKQVFKERREGHMILSGIHGYFLPSDDSRIARGQIEAFRREQIKHAKSHAETAALAEQMLRQLGGGYGCE